MEFADTTGNSQTAMGIEILENSRRAKNLIEIFWVVLGLTVLGIAFEYLELDLLEKMNAGEVFSNEVLEANDSRQMVLGLITTVMRVISIVVFLSWFRRAYGNLHRLGVFLSYGESAAIWSWFVPFISLFFPVRIMTEIWSETQEKLKSFDSSYKIQQGGIWIGLWWILFVISNLISQFTLQAAFKDETIEQAINASKSIVYASALEIPEALLVIVIVTKLSKVEARLAEQVKRLGGEVIYK